MKDRAIRHALAGIPGAGDYSVYWVDDRVPYAAVEPYRVYEWTVMFHQVWGGESRIAFGPNDGGEAFLVSGRQIFTHEYLLGDLDPGGCRAILEIRPAGRKLRTEWDVGWDYVMTRIFRPGRLTKMLEGTVSVSVRPSPDSPADCKGAVAR